MLSCVLLFCLLGVGYARGSDNCSGAELRSARNPVGDCYLTEQGNRRDSSDPFHNSPDLMKRDWENGVLLSQNYVDWSRGCWSGGMHNLPHATWMPELLREWAKRLKNPKSGWIGYRIVRDPHFPKSARLLHQWAAKYLVHEVKA